MMGERANWTADGVSGVRGRFGFLGGIATLSIRASRSVGQILASASTVLAILAGSALGHWLVFSSAGESGSVTDLWFAAAVSPLGALTAVGVIRKGTRPVGESESPGAEEG